MQDTVETAGHALPDGEVTSLLDNLRTDGTREFAD
jgi:hypothetical protein